MEIYTGTQIQASIREGSITCVPFRESQIEAHSLLVGLGSYYYHTEQDSPSVLYNPLDANDIAQYFDGPFKALPYDQQNSLSGLRAGTGIAADHPVILLKPGERIIAHTYEFIGTPTTCIVHLEELPGWRQGGIRVDMLAKDTSTVARQGLIIHNANTHKHVTIPVFAPIARLFFAANASETAAAEPGDTTADTAISTWTPAAILAGAISMPANAPAPIEGLSYE